MPEKSVTFYAYWANRYLTFSKRLKNADAAEALRRFLEDLQSRENIADWQIQQAKEAIQLYTDHFHGGKKAGIAGDDAKTTLAFLCHSWLDQESSLFSWIPAFAGMTLCLVNYGLLSNRANISTVACRTVQAMPASLGRWRWDLGHP